ncbi:MAG: hypothetical protein WCC74_03030 [Minisyncoccia bacterium]
MKQTIYIIPGFGESLRDAPYLDFIEYLKSKKYNVVFYQPKWKWNTIERWLEDFNKIIDKNYQNDSIILAFSLGAYIAVLSTKYHTFSKLILCSLSPYFSNDINFLPKIAEKILGRRRFTAFRKQDFPNNTKTPAIFLCGSEEKDLFPNGDKKYFDLWKGKKKRIIVSNSDHDISNPNYVKEIKNLLDYSNSHSKEIPC